MKNTSLLFTLTILISGITFGQNQGKISAKYLNQKPPGLTPEKFAPGLISLDNQNEFGSIFSRDGGEFYYAIDVEGKAEIQMMKFKNNVWTEPEKLLVHEKYSYNDQFLSPDENRLFFISDRPLSGTGEKKDYDIWYVKKEGDNWSKPINVGNTINSAKNEYYVSFAKDGTMYFSSNIEASGDNKSNYDIYASKEKNGEFQKPVKLSPVINTPRYEADVFIAYDESYLIFCGDLPEGYGKGDLYISFKNEDGSWTKPKNMGKVINTAGHELCPFVTKDGKYFFYTSNKDIYWVDATVIKSLRKK